MRRPTLGSDPVGVSTLLLHKAGQRHKAVKASASPEGGAHMGGEGAGKRQLSAAGAGAMEEEQVEEFFGLLKSVREMRERRCPESLAGFGTGKRTKVARSAAWSPAFEWDDFAGDVKSGSRPAAVPVSPVKGEERKEKKVEDDNNLDLKLSL